MVSEGAKSPFRAVSFTNNTLYVTALANDSGFGNVLYSSPLKSRPKRSASCLRVMKTPAMRSGLPSQEQRRLPFIKFEHICRALLGQPFDASISAEVNEKFSAIVYRRLLECPFVPGARDLLSSLCRYRSHVCRICVSRRGAEAR